MNYQNSSNSSKFSPVRILCCTVAELSKRSLAQAIKLFIIKYISLSTVVLNSRDRQGNLWLP